MAMLRPCTRCHQWHNPATPCRADQSPPPAAHVEPPGQAEVDRLEAENIGRYLQGRYRPQH